MKNNITPSTIHPYCTAFRCIITFLLGILHLVVQSQVVVSTGETRIVTEQQFRLWKEADSIQNDYLKKDIPCGRMDIISMNGDLFLLADGQFDVFIWKKNRWENLYKGVYYGYNYGAKKFVFNDKLYSFGGNGYWNGHSDLIYFDWQRGEWELTPVSGRISGGIASLSDKTLHLYGKTCHSLHLASMMSKEVVSCKSIPSQDSAVNMQTLEFTSYTIAPELKLLIEKTTQKLLRLTDTSSLPPFKAGTVYEIRKDSLLVWRKNNQGSNAPFILRYSLSIPLLALSAAPIREQGNAPPIVSLFLLTGSIILATGFVWLWKVNNRGSENKASGQSLPDGVEVFVDKLTALTNTTLTSDELDSVFGINTLTSPDTLRFKRAQIIREVNQYYTTHYGKDLIQRQPDPSDGRKYIYVIENKSN